MLDALIPDECIWDPASNVLVKVNKSLAVTDPGQCHSGAAIEGVLKGRKEESGFALRNSNLGNSFGYLLKVEIEAISFVCLIETERLSSGCGS